MIELIERARDLSVELERCGHLKCPETIRRLADALEQSEEKIKQARREAFELAAKVAEPICVRPGAKEDPVALLNTVASEIRALIEKEERPMSDFYKEIRAERVSQIAKWGNNHDDEHTLSELLVAAARCVLFDTGAYVEDLSERAEWGLEEKHEKNKRRRLIIAAALIVAELERMERASE